MVSFLTSVWYTFALLLPLLLLLIGLYFLKDSTNKDRQSSFSFYQAVVAGLIAGLIVIMGESAQNVKTDLYYWYCFIAIIILIFGIGLKLAISAKNK